MKKSIYNIFFGVLGQVVVLIIGLCLPRLRIVSFGSEVNGMLSSVQQVYTYLALLEAGIGSATLQALYGPVANDNKDEINSILAATNKYYKKTGTIYFFSILVFAVVYPVVVVSDISKTTVIGVILFNGLGNVLAYFFQGKYRILLQAEGKQYIITNLATIVSVLTNVIKVALIFGGFGVISLQIVYFLFNILQVLYFAWYIRRYYKWIDLKVSANYDSISQKNAVLVHQVSQLVFNNTDVMILTLFCDLKLVSVYALYNMIYDMVSTLISNINNGFSYKLGQLYNSNTREFMKLYSLYEVYYTSLSFALYCIAYIFIFDFISLYTEGVTDTEYMLRYLPILFTLIKLMVSGRAPSGFVATYAGHFKKTQNRAIIEAVLNLSVSLVCVNFMGIYGVLIGTVVSLLYRANDMIIYANIEVLHRNPWATYKYWLVDIVIFVFCVTVFNRILPSNYDSYVKLFVIGGASSILILAVFLGLTFVLTYRKSKPMLEWVVNRMKRRR